MDDYSRREFLEFMGRSSLVASVGFGALSVSCTSSRSLKLASAFSSAKDDVQLLPKMGYSILIGEGDPIGNSGELFGSDNDFTGFVPVSENEGILWVNHEFFGWKSHGKKPEALRASMGGSLLFVRREGKQWKVVPQHRLSRRVTGLTQIPFAGGVSIAGKKHARGTLANCSGGVTPWNTFLSAEENYQDFFGDRDASGKVIEKSDYGWEKTFGDPPEHFGWIVEIDPQKGSAKKLVQAGRFSHEGATATLTQSGHCAVYSGDDASDRCLYKFISSKKGSLDEGTLYVADLKKGEWIALDWATNATLKKAFKSQLDVLIHTREAATLVGGTPLMRPEGIAIDKSGAVFASLTGHDERRDPYGSILKIEEKGGDAASLTFSSSTFLAGGKKTGFACPDNLAFDPWGNLWITTDVSEKSLGKGAYGDFKANGLFVVPMSGPKAGIPTQVASAPNDAEFTGPSFSPDGRTLFLSVQHPGAGSKSLEKPTSRWPTGSEAAKSSVIQIPISPKLFV